MSDRTTLASEFLRAAGWDAAHRALLASDASARRYERLCLQGQNAVLMDAAPEHGEDVTLFTRMARWLTNAGLSAPQIFAEDTAAGFLLIEDLGDNLFARLIACDPAQAAMLYLQAAEMLAQLHPLPPPGWLSHYDPARLGEMVSLTPEWYLRGLGLPETDASRALPGAVEAAARRLLTGPGVVCLRDCHAENLLWLPAREGPARVGLLDFQDAFVGHPAYDLVSLLQDARRDIPAAIEAATIAHFCEILGADPKPFAAAYAFLGAQRSLRILGIFARLALRDAKPQYLVHIPRVWAYIERNLAHGDLTALKSAVNACLPAPTPNALERIDAACPPDSR